MYEVCILLLEEIALNLRLKYQGNQFYVFSLRHLIGHYIFTNRNQTKIQAQYHHDNIVDILSLLSLYFHTA